MKIKSRAEDNILRMGVGLKYNMLGLNFSYLIPSGSGITRNPLSNTIRFGFVFDLDGRRKCTGQHRSIKYLNNGRFRSGLVNFTDPETAFSIL